MWYQLELKSDFKDMLTKHGSIDGIMKFLRSGADHIDKGKKLAAEEEKKSVVLRENPDLNLRNSYRPNNEIELVEQKLELLKLKEFIMREKHEKFKIEEEALKDSRVIKAILDRLDALQER